MLLCGALVLEEELCAWEFGLAPREALLPWPIPAGLPELFAALPFEWAAALAVPGFEALDVDEADLSPPPELPVVGEVALFGGGGVTGVERMESRAT